MPTKPLKYMSDVYQGPSHITEDDPNAIEFSNAAYDRMFSEEAGYPQRDPNAEPYRPPPPNPVDFVNSQFEQFKGQYKQTFKRLKQLHGNDTESFSRAVAELDAEAEQFEAQHANVMGQITYLQGLADSGYDADTILQAQNKAVGINLLAEPVERTVTPSATGMSPGTSNSWFNRWDEMGFDAISYDPGVLSFERVDKNKVKSFYKKERKIANLNDPRKVNEIPGFNETFLRWVASERGGDEALLELLDPKTGDDDMLRWFSKFSETSTGRVVNDKIDGVSPIAKSVWSLMGTKKPPRGSDQRTYGALNFGRPQTATPKRQTSPSTGRTRVSYDGGKTWQNE